MGWLLRVQTLPLLVAALLCLCLAVLALRRRPRGRVAFSVLMLAVAAWSVGYALELAAADPAATVLWAKMQYVGIVLVPVAWLVFSLQFSGILGRAPVPLLLLLLALPGTTLVILWRPQTEHLMWSSTRIDVGASVSGLASEYGPWFWLQSGYSYLLYLVASFILLRALVRAPRLYRKQRVPLLVAILVPFIGNLLYVSGLVPGTTDPTPFALAISGAALAWALLRRRFLELMPVARAAVFEGMRDAVVVLDPAGSIVDMNRAAQRLLGRAEGFLGEHSSTLSGHFSGLDRVVDGGEWQEEVKLEVDGQERCYDLRSWPLNGESPQGRLLVFRDITEQRQAELARRESEQRLEILMEQIPAVLWTVNPDFRFTLVRGAGLRELGLEPDEVVGRAVDQVLPAAEDAHPALVAHREALEGRPSTYEMQWAGRELECHVEPLTGTDGKVVGVIGIGMDVTERRSLQQQLRHSQKMEAIGRMAGGVAHDFNNLLTAVAGYAHVAQQDLDLIPRRPDAVVNLRRDLDAIEHAAERATSLTSQLLAFSRRQALQARRLDLDELIVEMEKMVRRLIGAHIELVTDLDGDLEPIKADPMQLQQVVINLVLNSRDAMPQGGKLTLETGTVEVDEPRPVRYDLIEPGRYVVLTVRDTGVGMDAHVQAHLFEPFFSTKSEGKGTGLGLSTVYGIIKQSDGYVDVESRPGGGATFRTYFPVASPAEDKLEEPEQGSLRGDETVLVVEDEEMVRALATRILSSHGYSVLEAEEGHEALELCARLERPVDLLITDVVMPGMNGAELASRVKALMPGVQVVYISGYTGGALLEHGILDHDAEFVQKPFSPQDLARRVRQVLNGK